MTELNKQQLCAALNISESTVRRLEQAGLPFTPVGVRSHRYDLDECKTWLRTQYVPGMTAPVLVGPSRELMRKAAELVESSKGRKLRVYPSSEQDDKFMESCRRAQARMSLPEKE